MALRKPCLQINHFQKGCLKEMAEKDQAGKIVRKAEETGIKINPP
ncbi:MAG: hypothetical protein OFPII_36380 [Osedax symbiont Rs1]|nr:MAG: hypothetical protein OFPII_36380 [Osedax symbiont Rs1]